MTRLSFTEQSEQAILLVAGWMEEAGMKVRRDAVNNLIGRHEGMDPDAPVLLIGSHLDSVAEAGKYDGILGVVAAIEVSACHSREWDHHAKPDRSHRFL